MVRQAKFLVILILTLNLCIQGTAVAASKEKGRFPKSYIIGIDFLCKNLIPAGFFENETKITPINILFSPKNIKKYKTITQNFEKISELILQHYQFKINFDANTSIARSIFQPNFHYNSMHTLALFADNNTILSRFIENIEYLKIHFDDNINIDLYRTNFGQIVRVDVSGVVVLWIFDAGSIKTGLENEGLKFFFRAIFFGAPVEDYPSSDHPILRKFEDQDLRSNIEGAADQGRQDGVNEALFYAKNVILRESIAHSGIHFVDTKNVKPELYKKLHLYFELDNPCGI